MLANGHEIKLPAGPSGVLHFPEALFVNAQRRVYAAISCLRESSRA
jgi:hypothetical protein